MGERVLIDLQDLRPQTVDHHIPTSRVVTGQVDIFLEFAEGDHH